MGSEKSDKIRVRRDFRPSTSPPLLADKKQEIARKCSRDPCAKLLIRDREGRTAIAYLILDVPLPTTFQSADDLAVGPRSG